MLEPTETLTVQRQRNIPGLCGNNAAIVCSDADPLEAAAAIVAGAFGGARQYSLSIQRVYAHISVFEQVLCHVTSGAKALRTGLKFDHAAYVGLLINESEARGVEEWVEEARDAGARVHTGGRRHGSFYEPTVLTDVYSWCRVIREEVLGPVVSILPFIEVRDAVYEVNNSGLGVHTRIFTKSMDLSASIADKLHR